jgi:hypothetical protein
MFPFVWIVGSTHLARILGQFLALRARRDCLLPATDQLFARLVPRGKSSLVGRAAIVLPEVMLNLVQQIAHCAHQDLMLYLGRTDAVFVRLALIRPLWGLLPMHLV